MGCGKHTFYGVLAKLILSVCKQTHGDLTYFITYKEEFPVSHTLCTLGQAESTHISLDPTSRTRHLDPPFLRILFFALAHVKVEMCAGSSKT